MKPIKFKIWDIDHKIMVHSAIELKNDSILQRVKLEERTSDNVLWLQYTGIKDMEGNEIYEGDILRKFDGKKYVILWDSGDAGFVSVDLKEYILKPESRLDERDLVWVVCEVIGNIHENPELLK